jgi:hypothetical protein
MKPNGVKRHPALSASLHPCLSPHQQSVELYIAEVGTLSLDRRPREVENSLFGLAMRVSVRDEFMGRRGPV